MIEQLRIQCPSCGIILDVRNSKHEAVKRITCPHCQKQLAIDFQEEEKPSASPQPLGAVYYGEMRIDLQEGINQIPLPGFEFVEIKVVRLNDGNSKCMVRPLDDAHEVMLNGEKLQADDQVALAKGDQLQTGKIVLVYGKSGTDSTPTPKPPIPPASGTRPQKEHSFSWLYAALACVFLAIAIIVLWPSNKKSPIVPKPKIEKPDTANKSQDVRDVNETQKKKDKTSKEKSSTKQDYIKKSDYDLEQLAMNGDVYAQYILGNRLVHKSGSNSIIRGIKYLNKASHNGSHEARQTLAKVISALQRKADNGDSVAYQILNTIDNQ